MMQCSHLYQWTPVYESIAMLLCDAVSLVSCRKTFLSGRHADANAAERLRLPSSSGHTSPQAMTESSLSHACERRGLPGRPWRPSQPERAVPASSSFLHLPAAACAGGRTPACKHTALLCKTSVSVQVHCLTSGCCNEAYKRVTNR